MRTLNQRNKKYGEKSIVSNYLRNAYSIAVTIRFHRFSKRSLRNKNN